MRPSTLSSYSFLKIASSSAFRFRICQFLLLPADLSLKLGGLLAANVGGELCRMFPRRTRHPVQVLQYDLIQNVLPDVVACAGFSIFLVGAVGKVIVRLPALLCVIVRS